MIRNPILLEGLYEAENIHPALSSFFGTCGLDSLVPDEDIDNRKN